jgi:SPX domain protein involved in polyphosphate accumulation
MKFARGLYSNQDPQWESEYIDYIQLKEQLKSYHVDEKEAQRGEAFIYQTTVSDPSPNLDSYTITATRQ